MHANAKEWDMDITVLWSHSQPNSIIYLLCSSSVIPTPAQQCYLLTV